MSLPVELTFEILPPLQHEGQWLPAMIDITRIELSVLGPGGKPHSIDITRNFPEQEIMLLEDEILEFLQKAENFVNEG